MPRLDVTPIRGIRVSIAGAITRSYPPHCRWYAPQVRGPYRPLLLDTPAAVRFLSCEPLLERIDIDKYLGLEPVEPEYPWEPMQYERFEPSGIHWVIVGGESGAHARLFCPEWSLIEECQAAGVPVFIKQLGSVWAKAHHAKDHHGGDMDEWPEHLRIRQFPEMGV